MTAADGVPIPAAANHELGIAGARRTGALRRLVRSHEFIVGSLLFGFWAVIAVLGDAVTPYDAFRTNPVDRLESPSASHLFGTDALGRDVLSRVMLGSRDILSVSLLAASLATAFGSSIGLVMGYFGGLVDEVLSRVAEAVISLPSVIFALMVITALGPSIATLIGVVAFRFSWVIARTVRVAVLTERDEDYVSAALVRGERTSFILFGEIFPNVTPVIVVEFTTRIAFAIFAIANLSFLGFGVQAPSPDWGLQIADAYSLLPAGYWWIALFPATAIATLVVGVYLMAEAMGEVIEQ
jgi:peptide/nickel transport system permease protein